MSSSSLGDNAKTDKSEWNMLLSYPKNQLLLLRTSDCLWCSNEYEQDSCCGHAKMDSTESYLGVEVKDALAISEAIEI